MYKNWNARPIVEFVAHFGNVMPHSSKLTALQFLSRDLVKIQTELKLFQCCNIDQKLNGEIAQWEIKEDTHKLAILLLQA